MLCGHRDWRVPQVQYRYTDRGAASHEHRAQREEEESLPVELGFLIAAVRAFAAAANVTDDELQTNESNERVWERLRDAVRTAGHEIRAAKSVLPIDKGVLASIHVATLVLLGSEQDHPTYNGVKDLADQLPLGSLGLVPGRHLALVFAPDDFAAAIRSFLASAS